MIEIIESPRLRLSRFEMSDVEDVFQCITPAITRFMRWDPPTSFDEYKLRCEHRVASENHTDLHLVVRHKKTMECFGVAGLEGIDGSSPELGIWLKESAHGFGYGREAVRAVAEWASRTLKKESFIYPVALENASSRRIAEELSGEIIENRSNPKYESVVYKIPALRS